MDHQEIILNELKKYDFVHNEIKDLTEIRVKDGILYRFSYQVLKCVIKYFEQEAFRREIFYYQLLGKLQIPTIKLYDSTDTSIILEDINNSNQYKHTFLHFFLLQQYLQDNIFHMYHILCNFHI